MYNNDGQILYRFSDSGVEDEQATDTEYAYANGHPVGQTGSTADGGHETFLDSGRYNLVQFAKTGETIKYAEFSARALKVASVASKQLIEGGEITSFVSLASAALGPISVGGGEQPLTLFDPLVEGAGQKLVSFVTPWAELAETAIRNGGDLDPADWANALGGTLNAAFATQESSGRELFGGLVTFDAQLSTNLIIGGVLSRFDKAAGESYLANVVGNEVGQNIGSGIVAGLNVGASALSSLRQNLQETFRKSVAAELAASLDDRQDATAAAGVESPGPVTPTLEAPEASDHQETEAAQVVAAEPDPVGEHVVQKGESLSTIIARHYEGVGFDAELILKIAAYNGLDDVSVIHPGKRLILPPLDSELLSGQDISDSLRATLILREEPSVTPIEAGDGPILGLSTGFDHAALSLLSDESLGLGNPGAGAVAADPLAAQRAEVATELKALFQHYARIVKARQDAAEGQSTLENLLVGIGGAFVGAWEGAKSLLSAAKEGLTTAGTFAANLAKGDFEAAGEQIQAGFESAEAAADFVAEAADITQLIYEDEQLQGIVFEGIKDVFGEIDTELATVLIGTVIGEIILAAATAGAGAAVKAGRAGNAAASLFDKLGNLARLTRRAENVGPDVPGNAFHVTNAQSADNILRGGIDISLTSPKADLVGHSMSGSSPELLLRRPLAELMEYDLK